MSKTFSLNSLAIVCLANGDAKTKASFPGIGFLTFDDIDLVISRLRRSYLTPVIAGSVGVAYIVACWIFDIDRDVV
jgi:hypothetical protein